jgi:hypothetical protein
MLDVALAIDGEAKSWVKKWLTEEHGVKFD